MDKDKVTYFGQTDSRNKLTPFGIRADDRLRHVYVIGKTGMGKSTLLENMAVQDIQGGEGMVFIDPHGKTADLLLEYIPANRIKDVVYFAPFDTEYPISLNVLENVDDEKRHLVVTGLMSAFKKIWVDAWSARMEHILANTLFALLEYPGATLLGVNRMFADKDYRKKVVANIKDPSVKSYWTDEFAKYTEKYVQEATPAIQNKIGQFTGNPLIRNIIGQPTSSLDIRKAMDEKKIIIINLSKGRLGEGNANLLGSMFITKIYLAAMSRADLTDSELKTKPPFYMYVDEFQNFANESFADILSEARKYKLGLTIAHQYIEQMSDEVRAAVFGNVGTMITFRIGAHDADKLEKEFAPVFEATDMVSLGFAQIYLKLMINGVGSHPFSATTLPPIPPPAVSSKDAAIASSREQFAKPQAEVEAAIKEWYKPITPEIKPKPKDGPDNRTQDERPSLKPTVPYVPPEERAKKPPVPFREQKKRLVSGGLTTPVNTPPFSEKKTAPSRSPDFRRGEPKKKASEYAEREKNNNERKSDFTSSKHTPASSAKPQETISLNSLKPNMPKARGSEGREVLNSKNRASLRDALASALKDVKKPAPKKESRGELSRPTVSTPPQRQERQERREEARKNLVSKPEPMLTSKPASAPTKTPAPTPSHTPDPTPTPTPNSSTPPPQAKPAQPQQSAFRPPQNKQPTGNANSPREVPADVLRDVLE